MSDYIERKSIRNLYSCLDPNAKVLVAQVLIDIDAIPPIDIVRCKECKHWTKGDDTFGICHRCTNTRQMRYDDFCSRGKRKSDE